MMTAEEKKIQHYLEPGVLEQMIDRMDLTHLARFHRSSLAVSKLPGYPPIASILEAIAPVSTRKGVLDLVLGLVPLPRLRDLCRDVYHRAERLYDDWFSSSIVTSHDQIVNQCRLWFHSSLLPDLWNMMGQYADNRPFMQWIPSRDTKFTGHTAQLYPPHEPYSLQPRKWCVKGIFTWPDGNVNCVNSGQTMISCITDPACPYQSEISASCLSMAYPKSDIVYGFVYGSPFGTRERSDEKVNGTTQPLDCPYNSLITKRKRNNDERLTESQLSYLRPCERIIGSTIHQCDWKNNWLIVKLTDDTLYHVRPTKGYPGIHRCYSFERPYRGRFRAPSLATTDVGQTIVSAVYDQPHQPVPGGKESADLWVGFKLSNGSVIWSMAGAFPGGIALTDIGPAVDLSQLFYRWVSCP
jgi:hypothetical protein